MPGAVPLESIQGSAYEEKIVLKWREPAHTYGIITQYEVNNPIRRIDSLFPGAGLHTLTVHTAIVFSRSTLKLCGRNEKSPL